MNKSDYLIIFLIFFLSSSCEEVYHPTLTDNARVLVVDGVITNEAKSHTIYLSTAVPFNSSKNSPETGARVYVTDDKGSNFIFVETTPGTYESSPIFFKPQIGTKYILTIETKSNKIYKSSEQKLLSMGNSLDIFNRHKFIDKYEYVGDEFKLSRLEGAELIASLDLQSEPNSYFRFANIILVEYTELPPQDRLYYCWKKYNPNEYFNINNLQYNNSGLYQHDLGFFPFDTAFYGVVLGTEIFDSETSYTFRDIYAYIVTIKQHHLNNDIYEIYKTINKQLEAEQHIFDPIATQVIGNIKCISDPKEKVFGIFEASTVNITTYRIDPKPTLSIYKTTKISSIDMDSISIKGKNIIEPPTFWIY